MNNTTYTKWKEQIETITKPVHNTVLTYKPTKKQLKHLLKHLHEEHLTTLTLSDIEQATRKITLPNKIQTYTEMNAQPLHGIIQTKNKITGFFSTLSIKTDIPLYLTKLYCIQTWTKNKPIKISLHVHTLIPSKPLTNQTPHRKTWTKNLMQTS